MTDADETFIQPLATPVIVTIIRDRNDFPPVVQPIADGLLNLNSGVSRDRHLLFNPLTR